MSDFKKKYFKTCIIGLCIVAVLAVVFIFTGNDSEHVPVNVTMNENETATKEPDKVLLNETRGIVEEKTEDVPSQTPVVTPTPHQDMNFTENIRMETIAPTVSPELSQTNVPQKTVCYININCKTLKENPQNLKPEKKELVPSDGMILSNVMISFSEGDSLFDILQKAAKENKIVIDFEKNTAGGIYVKGIGNLYERDAGDMSGWGFTVNGEYPGVSCEEYKVKNDDKIEWIYMQ